LGVKKTQALLLNQLASNLREYRKAAGYSQEGLALEAEVDRTYVSQIERGVCNPSLLVLHKIATVLQVSVVNLLEAGS
jgi:transcriptional regulator with XRE-family HTH domain